MEPASEASASVAFGRFRVLPHRRELLVDGRPIKLGGRAFDVLMALIEARGAVVSKGALMTRVWPDRIVEENSLQAQIAALRTIFGAERGLIRTVSGRGYQFTGEIRILSAGTDDRADAGVAAAEPAPPPTNLSEAISELIGRDDELAEILNLAAAHRLVTLTGAGGIGKTRLVLAMARELRQHFADGVWLAEFSPLSDPGLVPTTVASAVGLEFGTGEVSAQRVAQALADRRLLLVLDTCEHVITAGAADAEDDDLTRYGAVRLFVERARATVPHFVPGRRLMTMVAAICRRLDGIPLAIELAAARASALGIEELAARLDDRFHLLTGGSRCGPGEPRDPAVESGRRAFQSCREVARRGGGRRPRHALPAARHDAELRARKARRGRRSRTACAQPRRILPGSLRAGRSRMGHATHGRMACRLRTPNR